MKKPVLTIALSFTLAWGPSFPSRAQDPVEGGDAPDGSEVAPAPKEEPSPGAEAQPTETPDGPRSSDGFDPRRAVVKPSIVTEEQPKPAPRPSRPPTVPKARDNGDPEKDLFQHAELLFKHEYWYLARQQYQKFTTSYPRSANAPAAMYKTAECYSKQGDLVKADYTYEQLLRSHGSGPYVGLAAYKLAEARRLAGDFQRAIPYYELAEQKAEMETIRLVSGYNRGRCLQQLNGLRSAEEAYKQVVAKASDQPSARFYHDASLLALARIEVAGGRTQDALRKFIQLTTSSLATVKAEALAKAGVISQELGNADQAIGYLNEAFPAIDASLGHADKMQRLPGDFANQLRTMALAALLTYHYKLEQYREVLDAYQRHRVDFSQAEKGASVLLVVAHAYRRLGEYARAASLYDGIERGFPESEEAKEAAYRKLLCLHKSGDSQLAYKVDDYLNQQKARGAEDSPYFAMAQLVKAEAMFSEGQKRAAARQPNEAKNAFHQSADAFIAIRPERIPEKYRASVSFKRGWALMEAQRHDRAVESFTEFLAAYPTSEWVPQAYAKRAECHSKLRNFDAAARDCDELLAKFPNDRIAQAVLQRKALVEVERKNPEGTIQAFRTLLERFPDTRGVAEAHFFIGKALQEQEKYGEAIPELKKARDMDPAAYHEHATSAIILCHYNLSQVDEMAKEADVLLGNDPKSSRVSPKLLTWLGARYFQREEYERAARYLHCVANYEKPEESPLEIWNLLGKALLNSGKYQESLAPLDNYLAAEVIKNSGDRKASGLLNKATALSKLGKWKEAQACGEEALQLQSEGRVNAQANLLLGDVAFALKDYDDAKNYYGVVAALFDDEQLAPEALEKAARAFEKLGEPQKAADRRRDLRQKYPRFRGLKE